MKYIAQIVLAFATTSHAVGIAPELVGQLIQTCAKGVAPAIQAAVVSVESGGNAWVLHDNNDGQVYAPSNYREATIIAKTLITNNAVTYGERDSGVDIGLAQINSRNLPGLHTTVEQMLDPCANLAVSSHMLSHGFEFTQTHGSANSEETAWNAALQMYNSGHAHGDEAYVQRVRAAIPSPFVQRALAIQKPISSVSTMQTKTLVVRQVKPASEFYSESKDDIRWNS